MKVHIITAILDDYRYSIRVLVDGQLKDLHTVTPRQVVDRRNQLCERWSEGADEVTADSIPLGCWEPRSSRRRP